MRIRSVASHHYRIPLPAVLSDAKHGSITHHDLVTARILTEEGVEGLGYTYTVGVGGSALRLLVEQDLAPVLLQKDPREIEKLWQAMWWHTHWIGRGGAVSLAMSAVDIALWDLKSKIVNEPLWRFLGGNNPRVKAYAGGIDLYFTSDELKDQTYAFLKQGLKAIKMKVGRESLSEDLQRVAMVRQIVGEEFPLMVDANMGWTLAQAIRASNALADYGLYWLEEPIIPDDFVGYARIAREGKLSVAAGENLHTLQEFQQLMSHKGVAFPEPDVSNIGGITAWMKVARLAESNNLPVTSHGVHDIHVSLLAAISNASYLELHGFSLDRFMVHPFKFEDGEGVASDRPGHGVVFDWGKLAQYEVS